MTRASLNVLAGVGLLLLATPALAELTFEPATPVVGQPATIVVDQDGAGVEAEVSVTYYPSSAVERVVVLGRSGPDGRIAWTPEHAGVVTVSAGPDGSAGAQAIGVRYDGLPIKGLIVFLIAGSLLFGGVVVGASHILKGDYVDPTT